MDKLKIIRPNGEEEIAELTTDKSLVGNNYLKLDIGGVPHYAKVGEVIDTHMYTFNGVDGKKYYIKKEIGNVENPPSGDSPTLNVSGTVTLAQMPSDMYQRFGGTDGVYAIPQEGAGVITNNTPKYSVIEIGVVVVNGGVFISLAVDGISDFYNKPGIYATTIIKVKIGDVTFDTNRDGTNSLWGESANADFVKLKENIGKPLNFLITYP